MGTVLIYFKHLQIIKYRSYLSLVTHVLKSKLTKNEIVFKGLLWETSRI